MRLILNFKTLQTNYTNISYVGTYIQEFPLKKNGVYLEISVIVRFKVKSAVTVEFLVESYLGLFYD